MIPIWMFVVATVLYILLWLNQVRINSTIRRNYDDITFVLGCYVARYGSLSKKQLDKIATLPEN